MPVAKIYAAVDTRLHNLVIDQVYQLEAVDEIKVLPFTVDKPGDYP